MLVKGFPFVHFLEEQEQLLVGWSFSPSPKRLIAISRFVPLAVIVCSRNSLRGSGAGGLGRSAFCGDWFGGRCAGGGVADGVVSLARLLGVGVGVICFSALLRFCLFVTSSFLGSPGLPLPKPRPGVSPSWLLLALCLGAGLILGAFARVPFMARRSNIAAK